MVSLTLHVFSFWFLSITTASSLTTPNTAGLCPPSSFQSDHEFVFRPDQEGGRNANYDNTKSPGDCCARCESKFCSAWTLYPNKTCAITNMPPVSSIGLSGATSGVSRWRPSFDHLGVYTYKDWMQAAEVTPFRFKGQSYMMESVEGLPQDAPKTLAPGSYFRIRNLLTGAILTNVTESVGHAFFSAKVDYVKNVAWVFGAAHHRGSDNKGPCDVPPYVGCYVGAWSSTDLINWSHTYKALTLPDGLFTQNVAVAFVRGMGPDHNNVEASSLPRHQAVMELEGECGSKPCFSFAINTGSDGNLGANWTLLDHAHHSPTHACPFLDHDETSGYYYTSGGGETVAGPYRSKDLQTWESPPFGPVTKPATCTGINLDDKVAPFYTSLWASADPHVYDSLNDQSEWNWGHNDADVCCDDGESPTYLVYTVSQQGAPKGWKSKQGAMYGAIGVFNGTLREWYATFYDDMHAPHIVKAAAESPKLSLPRRMKSSFQ